MANPGIIIEIGADTKKALDGIAGVQKALGSNLTGAEKFSAGVKGAFLPAVGILGGLGAAAFGAAQKASDLAETSSKIGVIFGDSAGALQEWAKAAPNALGQSQQSALDAAATFATMGQAAGLSGDDLVGFSTKLTGLGSDLASFGNTTPEEAVNALSAALRGESEPLRKYGVMINDSVLKQEAMAAGIWDGKGALTQQQKVLATQAAILKQTTNAQGDFARTADGAANQQRILAANMEQTQTELGAVFLPILQSVTTALASFAGWVRENQTLVLVLGGIIGGLAAAIVAVNIAMKLQAAATMIVTAVQWAWNAAVSANPIGLIIIAIAAFIAAIVLLWNNCETFRNIVLAVWEAIKNAILAVVNWFKAYVWPTIKWVIDAVIAYYRTLWTVVKWVWDKIWNAIEVVVSWFQQTVAPKIQTVIGWLTAYFQGLWDGLVIIWDGIQTAIRAVADWFSDTLVPLIQTPIDVIKSIFEGLWTAISTVWTNITNTITNAWNTISGPMKAVGDWLGGLGSAVVGWFTGGGDTGGTTTNTTSRMGRSLSLNSGSATTSSPAVNVTINTGIGDPVAIARQVRQTLRADFLKTGIA